MRRGTAEAGVGGRGGAGAAGRLADVPWGAAGGAPAPLCQGSPGSDFMPSRMGRGPAPRALFRARTHVKGIPGHSDPPLGDARRLDPLRRTDGRPRLPALDPWEPSPAGGGGGAGNRPGGAAHRWGGGRGRRQMGARPAWGPATKATGRCSRPDVRWVGGAWEKPACCPAAALPRWLLGAGREQGAAGVATATGNGEAGSWRQGLRVSLVEAFYFLPVHHPYPNNPTILAVKSHRDSSRIRWRVPYPHVTTSLHSYTRAVPCVWRCQHTALSASPLSPPPPPSQ